MWWLVLAACGPDTLEVLDEAAQLQSEPELEETAETASTAETGQPPGPTGDTGPATIPCGTGARPELVYGDLSIVTLENGPHIIGLIAGPAELCEATCDVSWLTPLVARTSTGCVDDELPITIEYGQDLQLCTLVTTPPSFPATGHCRMSTGGNAELAWEILRDD